MLTVYTKPDCVFCVRAKNLLNNRGVEFEEKVLGVDITRDEFVNIYPWARTMPQIFQEDGTSIGGFSQLEEYFKDLPSPGVSINEID